MLNVIIPIVDNSKRYYKILESLTNLANVNVYIGVTSSLIKDFDFINGDNLFYFKFKDGSNREEIINSLQKYVGTGALLIMRKSISANEFNAFVNTKKDIVTCRRRLSRVKSFFYNIWQKILKLCLGVRLYDGDTSVIYFGEDISSVILNSSNLSYNSRVDRWKGIVQDVVAIEGEPVKIEKDKKSNFISALICIVALIVGSVVTTIVSIFIPVNIIVGLLLFCLDAICLSVIFFILIVTIFNNMVGKKQYDYAIEIENEINDNNKDITEENADNNISYEEENRNE